MAKSGIRVNVQDLVDVGRDLRRAAERFRHEVDVTMLEIGALVTEAGKKHAAEHGSKSIPGSVHDESTGIAAIVKAGGDEAPIGTLWEVGNKNSRRSAKTFRHPVFGNRNVWVEQPKHPFLAPARRLTQPEVTRLMEKTLERTLAPYGMNPEA